MGLHTENAPGLFVREFGAGPPLLLLHGLMSTGDMFRPVVAALVIAGSEDKAVPIAHARMLAAGIPHAELRVVEGAGHTLIWTHPNALVSLVKPYLAFAPT